MAYRNYGPNAGYVVAKDGTGDFLTIGAGLTAAASLGGSGTLYIKDGTYTENPTGVAGWNLVAWDADALTPNVIINGKFTFTSAGSVSISGIQLQTNSDNFLAVTGSAASVVNLTNCYLNCLNNTGISFSSSSGSALIYILNCTGNIATTGIALYTSSSSGTIHIEYSDIRNTGNSTTASSNSAGEAAISFCVFTFPLSSSSTGGLTLEHTTISCAPINATAATYNGTGPSTSRFNFYGSGTASAITIGTGVTVEITQSIVFSSNTNAITGLGTINYGGIVFDGSSSTINTSVQTPIPWPVKQGGTGSSSFTAYGPVVAASTTTGALTSVSPSSTSGIPFISQGSSANPAFGTCVVAGGGTAASSFTAYSVICAGTTSTGAFQNVSGVGTSGQVLTSNGASALPTWQNGASVLTITTVAHAASPYTVLATDEFLAVNVSGGVVTIKLPNAPTTGRVIYIKDSNGASATSNISVTTVGGTVTIDGQTTYTMNINYQSLSVVFDGTNYEVF